MYPAGKGTFPTPLHPSPTHHHRSDSPHHNNNHRDRQHSNIEPPPVGTPPQASYGNHHSNAYRTNTGTPTPNHPPQPTTNILSHFPTLPLPPTGTGTSNNNLSQFSLSSPNLSKHTVTTPPASRPSPTTPYLSSQTAIELYRSQILNTNTHDLLTEVRQQHENISNLYERLKQTIDSLPDLADLGRDLQVGKRELGKARVEVDTALREWRGDRGVFRENIGRVESALNRLRAHIDGATGAAIADEKEHLQRLEAGLRDLRGVVDGVVRDKNGLKQSLEAVEGSFGEVRDRFVAIANERESVRSEVRKLGGTVELYARDLRTLKEVEGSLKTEVSKVRNENKGLLHTVDTLAKQNATLLKEMESIRAEMRAFRKERCAEKDERAQFLERAAELEGVWGGIESNVLSLSKMVAIVQTGGTLEVKPEDESTKQNAIPEGDSHQVGQGQDLLGNQTKEQEDEEIQHPATDEPTKSTEPESEKVPEKVEMREGQPAKSDVENRKADEEEANHSEPAPQLQRRKSQAKITKTGKLAPDKSSIERFLEKRPSQTPAKDTPAKETLDTTRNLKPVESKEKQPSIEGDDEETIVVKTDGTIKGKSSFLKYARASWLTLISEEEEQVKRPAPRSPASKKRSREPEVTEMSPPKKRPIRHLISETPSTHTTMEIVIDNTHENSDRRTPVRSDPHQQITPPRSIDMKTEPQPPPKPHKRQLIRTDEKTPDDAGSDSDMVFVSERKVTPVEKSRKSKQDAKKNVTVEAVPSKRAGLRPRKK